MIEEKFEFRNIRRDEALQTAEIERICFPPNEACSEKMMVERVNRAPEYFLVAVDRTTGRIRVFSTVSQQMNLLSGMSFLQTPGCMIHRGRQSCCWGLTCSRNTAGRALRQN